MNDEELSTLIFEGNKKLKQNIKQYKNNLHHDYDELMIEQFKERYPERTEQMRADFIKKQPYLKYNAKALEKKLNKLILPPILERSDGYFYSITTKNVEGKSVCKTYGGYHLPLIEALNESEEIESKGGKVMIQMIEDLLDEFPDDEAALIKTIYGIPPYSDCDIEYIKETYNFTEDQIEEKHKEVIKKLRTNLIK